MFETEDNVGDNSKEDLTSSPFSINMILNNQTILLLTVFFFFFC
jgi:hypothetical protein